jgi:RNA polymerase sigma-70 factor (ECF subfamily)
MEQPLESEPEFDSWFNKKGHWQVTVPDWGKNPENALNDKEFMTVLKKCIEGLKEQQRMVFQLREIDGLSNKEICNILDLSATNLGVILYRARNSLRQCLTINWFTKDKSDI